MVFIVRRDKSKSDCRGSEVWSQRVQGAAGGGRMGEWRLHILVTRLSRVKESHEECSGAP